MYYVQAMIGGKWYEWHERFPTEEEAAHVALAALDYEGCTKSFVIHRKEPQDNEQCLPNANVKPSLN